MRHQRFGKKLNRDIKERKSLFKSLVSSLILHGKITTTVAKAKAVRGLIDKLVNKSKEGTLSTHRQIAGFLNRSDVVKKLMTVIAPKFKKRNSGFTRIVRTDERAGDGAPQAIMEWVEEIDGKAVTKPEETKDITKKEDKKEKSNK
jgi:large subunit ribosomal protein L17